jgi:hypothetical protein
MPRRLRRPRHPARACHRSHTLASPLTRDAVSGQSKDFISVMSFVMLSFASPKSIMHFSL